MTERRRDTDRTRAPGGAFPHERPAAGSVASARRAADEAQAIYHELQRRNDAMTERRRAAIACGDLAHTKRIAPEHRALILELRGAAQAWNLALIELLAAQLDEDDM